MSGPWDTERELKRAFALAMLKKPLVKPQDSYDLATMLYGGDTVSAMRAGSSWPADPEVLQFKDELLKEHGASFFLPSKEEIARDILAVVNEKYDNGHLRHNAKERQQLYRLYCEIMGYIEKPTTKGKGETREAPPDIVYQEYPDELPAAT